MSMGSQAKHLRQASRFAKRRLRINPEVVKKRNAEMLASKPLPNVAKPKTPAKPAQPVSRKATPTQAVSPLALSKHLSKNPKQAIQAGRQYGAPVMGTSKTLAELSRTPFSKLSSKKDLIRKAIATPMKPALKENVRKARLSRWGVGKPERKTDLASTLFGKRAVV